jgi:hypothetical protein
MTKLTKLTFADLLRRAAGGMTAGEAAGAVSGLLSRRTMESWLAGRYEPPAWAQEWILGRVKARKEKAPERKQNDNDT